MITANLRSASKLIGAKAELKIKAVQGDSYYDLVAEVVEKLTAQGWKASLKSGKSSGEYPFYAPKEIRGTAEMREIIEIIRDQIDGFIDAFDDMLSVEGMGKDGFKIVKIRDGGLKKGK